MRKSYGLSDWLLSRPFRDAQPNWSRKLGWYVGIPAWLAWGYFIVSGTLFEHQTLALGIFGVFMVVALIQNFHFLRGTGRDN